MTTQVQVISEPEHVYEVLPPEERSLFGDLEDKFEKIHDKWMEGWTYLIEIFEKRLYREDFRSWDVYLDRKWGISQSAFYRMMAAQKVAENIGLNDTPRQIGEAGQVPESQLRPLVGLPPEAQKEAWADANHRAAGEGRKRTAKDVKVAAAKVGKTSTKRKCKAKSTAKPAATSPVTPTAKPSNNGTAQIVDRLPLFLETFNAKIASVEAEDGSVDAKCTALDIVTFVRELAANT